MPAAARSALLKRFLSNNQYGNDSLASYSAGDTVPGETFTGNNVRTYFDVNGVLQTAGTNVKRDGHYIGGVRSLLIEAARTNLVIQNRDLTNAAWVKTNCAAVKDQTGIDNVANSASKLTASAGNATCLQAIVLGSSARAQFAYIKRITGAGNIDMTMDNGVTWTTVAVTGAFTKLTIPTQTLANPTVGFRIVTSGDAVAIDFIQNENGAFESSPIATAAAAVARTADLYSLPFNFTPREMSLYMRFVELGAVNVASARAFEISANPSATARLQGLVAGGKYETAHNNAATVTSVLGTAPVVTDVVELVFRLYADGSVDVVQSINGAAATTATRSGVLALAAAWSGPLLWLGTAGNGGTGHSAIRSMRLKPGIRSISEMRAA